MDGRKGKGRKEKDTVRDKMINPQESKRIHRAEVTSSARKKLKNDFNEIMTIYRANQVPFRTGFLVLTTVVIHGTSDLQCFYFIVHKLYIDCQN